MAFSTWIQKIFKKIKFGLSLEEKWQINKMKKQNFYDSYCEK